MDRDFPHLLIRLAALMLSLITVVESGFAYAMTVPDEPLHPLLYVVGFGVSFALFSFMLRPLAGQFADPK